MIDNIMFQSMFGDFEDVYEIRRNNNVYDVNEENNNKNLLPCPFCGSEDIRMGNAGGSIGVDIYIKCNCGAKIQICEEHGEEELINRWNRRR